MSRLILPGLHGEEPTMICRVPVAEDEVCGKVFYPGEERAFTNHCIVCARQNEQGIHENRLTTRVPAMEVQDPEWAAHQREVGRRMREEGRLVPKKNER